MKGSRNKSPHSTRRKPGRPRGKSPVLHLLPKPERTESSSAERRDIAYALRYWEGLRGGRALPAFHDIEPDKLARLWPFAFLADVGQGGGGPEQAVVLYSGSSLGNFLRNSTAGVSCAQCLPRVVWERMKHAFSAAVEEKTPLGVSDHYTLQDGRTAVYRSIIMPLSDEDGNVAKILGVVKFKLQSSKEPKES